MGKRRYNHPGYEAAVVALWLAGNALEQMTEDHDGIAEGPDRCPCDHCYNARGALFALEWLASMLEGNAVPFDGWEVGRELREGEPGGRQKALRLLADRLARDDCPPPLPPEPIDEDLVFGKADTQEADTPLCLG